MVPISVDSGVPCFGTPSTVAISSKFGFLIVVTMLIIPESYSYVALNRSSLCSEVIPRCVASMVTLVGRFCRNGVTLNEIRGITPFRCRLRTVIVKLAT